MTGTSNDIEFDRKTTAEILNKHENFRRNGYI